VDDVKPTRPESIPEVLAEKVSVNWHIPTGLASRYAHHMLVQATEFEVTLSFFELKPPVILGDTSPEVIKDILKQGIFAECIARVTIAKARYPEFLKAFTSVESAISPKDT
jgi:hypothetical protein